METQKGRRGKITFPKILGAVVIVWLAIVLIRPLFNHRVPMPLRALNGGDLSSNSDEMMMESVGVEPSPMVKSMPSRVVAGRPMVPETAMVEDVTAEVTGGDKRIIKNGDLRLKVESTEKSVEKIKGIAKEFNGEVANINIYRRAKNGLEGHLTVKVPVDKFEATYAKIKEVGDQVLSQSVGSDDITEQYVDLQAQIRNKKAEEETFRKLLERSGKLEDVLKVTREVARVRGEIDRLEGRIKFMELQTDMSTINVSLVEYEQIATSQDTWKPWRVVQKSLRDLVIKSQGLINSLIYFVIVQLPLLLVIALGIFILYKIGVNIFNKFRR